MDTDSILAARKVARAQKAERDRYIHSLHVIAADALATGDQSVRHRALEQVAKWELNSLCSSKYITAWRQILDMSPAMMRAAMLRDDAEGVALRQNTPFGFIAADTRKGT